MSKWQEEGTEGISKPKGRPPLMNNTKKKNTEKKLTSEQQLKKAPSFRDRYCESTAKTESRVIHELRKEFRLVVILEAIDFPKATYMYWQKRLNEENTDEEIEKVIKEINEENNGNYGLSQD